MSIRVKVDVSNPGQFFACCGLLELADRNWRGTEGWFEREEFCLTCSGDLVSLLDAILKADIGIVDAADIYSSPVQLGEPFNLRLDWWQDDWAGGSRLKPWAGTMRSYWIAVAMRAMLARPEARSDTMFDFATVVPDPDEPTKKIEPYYFDARRKENAHPRDVGFSPNEFSMTTTASPVVEFFCLVGLQRCRPCITDKARVFVYHTWSKPCPASLLLPAVAGLLGDPHSAGFQFENAFRTGQRKHKAFAPAIPFSGESDE